MVTSSLFFHDTGLIKPLTLLSTSPLWITVNIYRYGTKTRTVFGYKSLCVRLSGWYYCLSTIHSPTAKWADQLPRNHGDSDLKFMEVHSTPRRWILNLGTKWDVLFWSHCDLDFEPLQRLFGRAVSCALAPPLWPSRYCSPPWCQIHTGWGLTASGEC